MVEVNVKRDGYFEMKWVSSGSLMSHLVPSSFSSVWGKRARGRAREKWIANQASESWE